MIKWKWKWMKYYNNKKENNINYNDKRKINDIIFIY